MGKIIYQDCVVLKILRWQDDKSILTLLGKHWCVFSALWTLPKAKRTRRLVHPELFQNIHASIQPHTDGLHRLRDYRETPHPECKELSQYFGLNFLSRYFILTCEEGLDSGPWHIWQNHQNFNFQQASQVLNLMCELCYHAGTWPSGYHCEICNKKLNDEVYLEQSILACQHCQSSKFPIPQHYLNWIRKRFLQSNTALLDTPFISVLLFALNKRLPEQAFHDNILKKLWKSLHPQFDFA